LFTFAWLVIYSFDALKENYHCCGMDNLQISADYLTAAFKHKRKVRVVSSISNNQSKKGENTFGKSYLLNFWIFDQSITVSWF
jgi:hypothetical protein